MTTFEQDARTLELPWPFTGREDELELVRRSLTAGRHGIVVTGPAGSGRTRLVTEAVRGTDCARVAGTPEARHLPFAAFAHLLPESVTLHRAVRLLSGVRLLLVDDAHLLDDASAALVHQLAVQGRTRLVVAVTDGAAAPGAITRLWTGELLPRLALEPLPREETADLLTAGAGRTLEPLTVNRLHALCRGDLRLLRSLLDAVRERGLLARVPGTDAWAWRGPVPVTTTVRERTAHVLDRTAPEERDILDLLAFAEPLPLEPRDFGAGDPAAPVPLQGSGPGAADPALRTLERLEADGLVHADDHGAVRLAHPLYGPVLRATAGRLRARRLAGAPERCHAALEAEAAALARSIERADVRRAHTPVGEWFAAEGAGPLPAGYAAVRARFARLRGELREAAAWAREGLRTTADDPACRAELALAAAQSGDHTAARAITATAEAPGAGAEAPRGAGSSGTAEGRPGDRPAARAGAFGGEGSGVAVEGVCGGGSSGVVGRRTGDRPAVGAGAFGGEGGAVAGGSAGRGPYDALPFPGDPYDAVRLGAPGRAVGRLTGVFAAHADALARGDGAALDRAARALEERGFLLYAAEAYAQAAGAHRDPSAARTSRTRAAALARRCQGARTPALSGLVLGELTARQRQIVTLAAAGLSNRQIAERLTLSVRTVGNHLYSAYARLGSGDRSALPWLVRLPDAQPA